MSTMAGGRMRDASVSTLSQMRQLSCAMEAPRRQGLREERGRIARLDLLSLARLLVVFLVVIVILTPVGLHAARLLLLDDLLLCLLDGLEVHAPERAAEVAPRPGVLAADDVARGADGAAVRLRRIREEAQPQADVAQPPPHLGAKPVALGRQPVRVLRLGPLLACEVPLAQRLLRAREPVLGDVPRSLPVRRILLQVAEDAEQPRRVGRRRAALGAGEVGRVEVRNVAAEVLGVRVGVLDDGLPRAVEQAPADEGLGLVLAAVAAARVVVGRGAASEAEGDLGPEAQALEDLEGRDEGADAGPGAHVRRRRVGILGGREEGRRLLGVDGGRRLTGGGDGDGRDLRLVVVGNVFGSGPRGLGGVDDDLVDDGLHLQHASLDGPAAVDLDAGADEQGLGVDLPVGRLVRDDAHGVRQDLLGREGVDGREGVLERRLGQEDDLVERRQLGLLVGRDVRQRRREARGRGRQLTMLAAGLLGEVNLLEQSIVVERHGLGLGLGVAVLRARCRRVCRRVALGEDDKLAGALLLKLCPLSERAREGIREFAQLSRLLQSLARLVVTAKHDVRVGCLEQQLHLLFTRPGVFACRPHVVVEDLLPDGFHAKVDLLRQGRHVDPLRRFGKVGARAERGLAEQLEVPNIDAQAGPRQAEARRRESDYCVAGRRTLGKGVAGEGEELDVGDVRVRRDAVDIEGLEAVLSQRLEDVGCL
ncbi:LOW QUALITY PROTEIN: hypothetical protein CH63R_05091 [Colletotrichum higginsianum IMI 349063]|uniref:Uncharacterized protein n=1 Tax=Colletotrichum higginsianum (strain IMI 349063) TaxID=759273 RepID=A0A1B7YLA3_COLHI|nr:LOW QUALITY PROTEIN: hypothetical protein CH63R_05091 [Colletotrichum higginsianum IMI 349063]OBR12795.1 LOW QUALITY PROTEIN: hypothetical protein CH63R_05091 [Colletotrichum higginsianum IMI 349063]